MDILVFRIFYSRERFEIEQKLIIDNAKRAGSDEINVIFGLMDSIDNKASALLTHVSLVIATIAIFFQGLKSEEIFFRWVYIFEMAGCIAVALVCLRCIRMSSGSAMQSGLPEMLGATLPSAEDKELVQRLGYEMFCRRILYNFASSVSALLTIIFSLSVVMHQLI
ncbi:MAG: hypothetical protein O9322_07930 [Beijerinckiaceae bacterium]|nr:hypothetical protein [Beijerinckiaceae bacterium]MCZ8299456.1 hypothetical protein [Beijerinckiaceae bacterium]